jgi:hypothetical protein
MIRNYEDLNVAGIIHLLRLPHSEQTANYPIPVIRD